MPKSKYETVGMYHDFRYVIMPDRERRNSGVFCIMAAARSPLRPYIEKMLSEGVTPRLFHIKGRILRIGWGSDT